VAAVVAPASDVGVGDEMEANWIVERVGVKRLVRSPEELGDFGAGRLPEPGRVVGVFHRVSPVKGTSIICANNFAIKFIKF